MRLITVELVHPDGRILKVNANEVPVWKSRGWRIADDVGKTSGGEPQVKPAAEDNKPGDNMNDVII